MNSLRLGTRKSALALVQTKSIAAQLRATFPDLHIELVLITTSGDLKTEGTLLKEDKGGLKALFTKEIEEALLDHRIDLAVHSLKDMSAELPKGLKIAAVPLREDPRDAWISKTKCPFKEMPSNARIGTGAVRRQAQLRHLYPQVELIPIRGNVDTRMKKLNEENFDGIVLAMAGLIRLGLEKSATEAIPLSSLVPAVGQGCLGLQIRENDGTVDSLMKAINHPASHQSASAERAFLRTLGGSCQTPIAGHATVKGTELSLTGLVISPDGLHEVRGTISGPAETAESLGDTLAKQFLARGAEKLLCR
jgi:hydroxymethylbilane synthase